MRLKNLIETDSAQAICSYGPVLCELKLLCTSWFFENFLVYDIVCSIEYFIVEIHGSTPTQRWLNTAEGWREEERREDS